MQDACVKEKRRRRHHWGGNRVQLGRHDPRDGAAHLPSGFPVSRMDD
ncbi:MAG TPA: hypothetical protein VFT39_11780 [Vicinamibacterales bacterium]|nr:hypothetical protein [Vicinamibacterales bacterium]